jgi:hypothetical protein
MHGVIQLLGNEEAPADTATASIVNDFGGEIIGRGQASAFGATSAQVDVNAFGVNQIITADEMGTASVLNSGYIDATAFALASATRALGTASAFGVNQQVTAGTTATASVINSGNISGYAQASAYGATSAQADANAGGVAQGISAEIIGTASVLNSGYIEATAHALASATSGGAWAGGNVHGLAQNVIAGSTAAASVENWGVIGGHVKASAYGVDFAQAVAGGGGVGQGVRGGTLGNTALVDNYDEIAVSVKAVASAARAEALGRVFGIGQGVGTPEQTGLPGTASVNNSGHIEAAAFHLAEGSTRADANNAATGVNQTLFGNVLSASVNNSGDIRAVGTAFASAPLGSAFANVFSPGIWQLLGIDGSSANTATASVVNDYSGEIMGRARASAFGATSAQADANARGVNQILFAQTVATALVENHGTIAAMASALASATAGQAIADARAFGILQDLQANPAPGAIVKNTGAIEASADATARGFTPIALANAAAVNINGAGGALNAELTNSGLIRADAFADATGTAAPTAVANATGMFLQAGTLTGSILNSGSVVASATASGAANSAQAFGVVELFNINTGQIVNTGLINAYAQASRANAFGIIIDDNSAPAGGPDDLATITNDGGTIWAGLSRDGGATVQRGGAIDTVRAPNPVLIELKGTERAGHIFGYIALSEDDRIEVTQGKTFFDGTINGPEGSTLDIFDEGNLVLCQEGWQGACDPDGWGNAGPGGEGFRSAARRQWALTGHY